MSTKCTIDCDHENYSREGRPAVANAESLDWHLYYECLDEDNVYLRLSLQQLEEIANGRVTIRIPGQLWNRLVGIGALTSWGGEDFFNPKTPEERSKEMSDSINEFIESFGGKNV